MFEVNLWWIISEFRENGCCKFWKKILTKILVKMIKNFRFHSVFPYLNEIFVKEIEQKIGNPNTMISEIRPNILYKEIWQIIIIRLLMFVGFEVQNEHLNLLGPHFVWNQIWLLEVNITILKRAQWLLEKYLILSITFKMKQTKAPF